MNQNERTPAVKLRLHFSRFLQKTIVGGKCQILSFSLFFYDWWKRLLIFQLGGHLLTMSYQSIDLIVVAYYPRHWSGQVPFGTGNARIWGRAKLLTVNINRYKR